MDLTMLPSKKTVAQWESDLLVVAQGNSVIELTPMQAHQLMEYIYRTLKPSHIINRHTQDLGT